ncbi:flagellar hook-length control protein FliK [Luteibacter sp. Sphag1AF]|uniref:flagellar hook-length control protein FliK n=1 Tax=Luteibacter sp. Sphag1AF TaxID=2587031 RepID=UPI001607B1DD|nr:flagellar hook-length control protein FliK [Luteibacter sp. Sphag1AF]MBB3225591.1 flagellar hook-length control protein FliK [Luteibacter sp. Sphag1AF]
MISSTLNAVLPTSTASSTPSVTTPAPANGSTTSSHRFDAALDAANKQTANAKRDNARDAASASSGSSSSQSTAARPTATKKESTDESKASDKKGDDKDAADTGDNPAVAAVLALIGIPPKVTAVAGKALDAATDALSGKPDAALAGIGQNADAMASLTQAQLQAQAQAAAASAATAVPVQPEATAAEAGFLAVISGAAKDADAAIKPDASAAIALPAMHLHTAANQDPQNVTLQSTQPATSPQFAQELGEQVAWMGTGNITQARIKLHPEELGSMDVKVSVEHGKVNVAFATEHPAAVTAVQQTLAHLDTMLAHHGLSLGNAEVSQQQARQGGSSEGRGNDASSGDGQDDVAAVTTVRTPRGLVDEVA